MFDQEQLVAFARSFSQEYDFGIDPIAFIGSFVDSGILHFDNDNVKFALPFIESYLLASEMASAPTQAARYFEIDNDFDSTCTPKSALRTM